VGRLEVFLSFVLKKKFGTCFMVWPSPCATLLSLASAAQVCSSGIASNLKPRAHATGDYNLGSSYSADHPPQQLYCSLTSASTHSLKMRREFHRTDPMLNSASSADCRVLYLFPFSPSSIDPPVNCFDRPAPPANGALPSFQLFEAGKGKSRIGRK
jgi:hypothetical protein